MQRLDVPGFDEVYRVDCAGSAAFVAIHALLRGRAFGGVRIRAYASERAALDDALALAEAMSRKVVMAGLDAGGAKTVLMAPQARRGPALEALGAFVESLEGRYHCGPDVGFDAADEASMRRTTRHLARTEDLGEATARGVRIAMGAVSEPGHVAIQGLGAVGLALARMLDAEGIRVTGSDLEPTGAVPCIPPREIYDAECDVFAPCATGGLLDEAAAERLRCRVVCGGANNPLSSAAVAERLRTRGVTYVPDFLASAGAVIVGASAALGEAERVGARIDAIADRVREVVRRGVETGGSPHDVAVEMADARIAALRVPGT